MLVYLAGAIDFANEDSLSWRKYAKEALNSYGIHCFDPAGAFAWSNKNWKKNYRQLIEINKHALMHCDIVLVEYSLDCWHTGTVMEIYEADLHNKKIVIWCDREKPPLYLLKYNIQKTMDKSINEVMKIVESKTPDTRWEITNESV